MRLLIILSMVCSTLLADAQFAPQAGVAGSTAVSQNDPKIVGWASGCVVERGWLDIADKSLGKASFGAATSAIGKPDNALVSLGDSGIAILTFSSPIYNGEGPDFAVFENGFANPSDIEEAFLELTFVEVSSDGINYVRFPASSKTDTPQVPSAGVYMNARKVHNFAGKYIKGYGTPFDLDELKDSVGLDVNNITHIRLVDVIGSISGNGSLDKDGNTINDPYPTAFASGGFDLEAVAAIYMKGKWPSSVRDIKTTSIILAPNPAHDFIRVSADVDMTSAVVSDLAGRVLKSFDIKGKQVTLDVQDLNVGIYYLILSGESNQQWVERFSKY